MFAVERKIVRWWHDTPSERTPACCRVGLDSIASAALRQQRREHGAPFFRQPEPPRRIALDETSHDHRRHRRARHAGVLPIRVAGDAEQQDALRDAQRWVGFASRLLMSPIEHVAG